MTWCVHRFETQRKHFCAKVPIDQVALDWAAAHLPCLGHPWASGGVARSVGHGLVVELVELWWDVPVAQAEELVVPAACTDQTAND